jgi:hypothetical protein
MGWDNFSGMIVVMRSIGGWDNFEMEGASQAITTIFERRHSRLGNESGMGETVMEVCINADALKATLAVDRVYAMRALGTKTSQKLFLLATRWRFLRF